MTDPRAQLQHALGDAYQIERELVGGGMSRLFLATERALRRPVVIKVLPPELTSESSSARFRREIELAAQLRHPHILPVHAAGAAGSLLWYVMPFVTGESLRRRMDRERRLPISDACRVLEEVADALAYAHRSGVVHRDVKPENILLEHEHAILADFGIARVLTGGRSGERLTGTGTAIGTLGYMAPEQVAGESSIDARADIYALGVVGYEMLGGTSPFAGRTPRELLAAQMTNQPRPVRAGRDDIPEPLAAAIHRAISASPDARFRTAIEFRDALRDAARSRAPRETGSAWSISGAIRSLFAGRQRAVLPVARPPATECRVAVLPFVVRGRADLAYLGEGMVELLSSRIDGVGELCVADPRATLALVSRQASGPIDPAGAATIAEHLDAGMFVLGSLIVTGQALQATATLYGAGGRPIATAAGNVASESEVMSLVDKLAIGLLSARERSRGFTIGAREGMTTRLDALSAYLEGERLFRAGKYSLATEALQRATRADPEFALAWYRLSLAAEWSAHRELQDEAAEQALAHSARLGERDRRMLEAFVSWRRGEPQAESLYREIVVAYPDDVEAWLQLGEVIYHYGPLAGRSITESREAWERVLAFEPENLAALFHLARVAAVEGRQSELAHLTERALAIAHDSERRCELDALRAFAGGTSEDVRRSMSDLRQAGDLPLNVTLRMLATHTRDLDAVIEVAGIATDPSRSPEFRALAHTQRAYLQAARARWSDAERELDAAERLGFAFAAESRAYLALLPFREVARSELQALRSTLVQWDACSVPATRSSSLFVRVHDGAHPYVRAYLLGLLAIRLDDPADALRFATEIEGDVECGTTQHRPLGHALARSIRAHVALARGESATALQTLEGAARTWSYALSISSPFYSGALERWTLAGLLARHDRPREAVRLYGSFAEVSLYDLVFLAPSHAERARLTESLGDRAAADSHLASAAALGRSVSVHRPIAGHAATGR